MHYQHNRDNEANCICEDGGRAMRGAIEENLIVYRKCAAINGHGAINRNTSIKSVTWDPNPKNEA